MTDPASAPATPPRPTPPPPTGRTANRPRSAGKPKVPTDKIPTEQELRRWAQACPLWKWRASHRISRPMMAAMMEVGATTIWLWEHGSSVPNAVHMDRLVTLLGPETIVRWVRWMDKRPGWGERPTPADLHHPRVSPDPT